MSRNIGSPVSTISDKDAAELRSLFDYERLSQRFGKVEAFYEKRGDYRNWTFWTYAKRSAQIFGPLGVRILGQLKRHRYLIRYRANKDLEFAVSRRTRAASARRQHT